MTPRSWMPKSRLKRRPASPRATNIVYRRHKNPEIIRVMDEWWAMIEKYSKRDQLALSFILWKHGITVESVSFENARLLKDDFFTLDHA